MRQLSGFYYKTTRFAGWESCKNIKRCESVCLSVCVYHLWTDCLQRPYLHMFLRSPQTSSPRSPSPSPSSLLRSLSKSPSKSPSKSLLRSDVPNVSSRCPRAWRSPRASRASCSPERPTHRSAFSPRSLCTVIAGYTVDDDCMSQLDTSVFRTCSTALLGNKKKKRSI